MSAAIQAKLSEAQQALDSATASLAGNQAQTQQLQAAVTSAQQRVDELTALNAAVDAEVQATNLANSEAQVPFSAQPYTPAVDANGQPVEQPVQG